jgi:rubrerythrin
MHKDLTALDVIGLAVKSEEAAADFYGHLSKQIKNSLVRSKFEDLAREEVGHRKILVNLYRKMTGGNDVPADIPGSPDLAEGGFVPRNVKDIEELLRMAIEREQRASAFYRKASAEAADLGGKRTLEYLADIEHGHEAMLKTELEAYLRDSNWYSNNPDVQLVGP